LALYLYLAAVVGPLFLWALLAIYARYCSDRLRPLLPWLTVLAWVLWPCAIVLPFLSLIGKLRGGLLIIPLYFGINAIRGWIKQRVDPRTKESPDRLRPAPKNP
jgi:hypothetical protein